MLVSFFSRLVETGIVARTQSFKLRSLPRENDLPSLKHGPLICQRETFVTGLCKVPGEKHLEAAKTPKSREVGRAGVFEIILFTKQLKTDPNGQNVARIQDILWGVT